MKEITIKTIGWTLFGCIFVIMFFGMFIILTFSDMDGKISTFHYIEMDNNTKESINKLSEIYNNSINSNIEKENICYKTCLFSDSDNIYRCLEYCMEEYK